ncbi:uncharacterized protein LOC113078001 [Carassius auratus]|uniref:Uncharacterized protein LOC113078001 n=1 Tax=Carassius auratus TaxID=7957 RepID=A0A6P6NC25_CARAU|nr:uncharacterized protein LOC113078001 [Carassius auratus]
MQSPSSTPLADIISSLAVLHREQHQALLDLRTDQERQFQAIVQAQQEDRERFRGWIDREVRAEAAGAPAAPVHLPLHKMGAQDDPEAFLELFEKAAEACGWPREQWPVRLIPLLSGEAQVAAQQLPVANLLVFNDLKRAIIQRVSRSPEPHCHTLPGLGRGRPALRDGPTAPGLLPQVATGRGERRGACRRPGGAGAVHHSPPQEDGRVGPVPPPRVAGLGHPPGGGPHGGVPRGRHTPAY